MPAKREVIAQILSERLCAPETYHLADKILEALDEGTVSCNPMAMPYEQEKITNSLCATCIAETCPAATGHFVSVCQYYKPVCECEKPKKIEPLTSYCEVTKNIVIKVNEIVEVINLKL